MVFAFYRKGVVMGTLHPLDNLATFAPPAGTPEHAKYMRYAGLWMRLKQRTAELQQQIDQLQSEIAVNIVEARPQAVVVAAETADRLAIDAIDLAQLMVFAEYLCQHLDCLCNQNAER